MRCLTKEQVSERTTLSIPTIYKQMRAGKFPKSIRISKGRVAWPESDIDKWIEEKLEAAGHIPWGAQ